MRGRMARALTPIVQVPFGRKWSLLIFIIKVKSIHANGQHSKCDHEQNRRYDVLHSGNPSSYSYMLIITERQIYHCHY